MSAEDNQFVLRHDSPDGSDREEKTFDEVGQFWATVDLVSQRGLDYEYDTPSWYDIPGEQ